MSKVYLEPVDWLVMNQDTDGSKSPTHVTNTQAMTNTYQVAWFRMASRMWLTRGRG